MNKSKAIFLFILFVGFGFLGFLIMNGIKGLFSTTSTPTTAQESLDVQQQNFILIHLDDLSSKDPQLVSVWAVFFYPSNPPSITLKELYPHTIPNQEDEQVKSSFSITENKELGSKFRKQLDTYQFPWSGYLIVDHQAVKYLNDWLQIQTMPLSLQQAVEIPGAYVLTDDENQWFNQVCGQLQTLDLQTTGNIPWAEMIPDHYHSNIIFDQMALIWDSLARSEIPPHCEVLIP
jgi:hypothetical protein